MPDTRCPSSAVLASEAERLGQVPTQPQPSPPARCGVQGRKQRGRLLLSSAWLCRVCASWAPRFSFPRHCPKCKASPRCPLLTPHQHHGAATPAQPFLGVHWAGQGFQQAAGTFLWPADDKQPLHSRANSSADGVLAIFSSPTERRGQQQQIEELVLLVWGSGCKAR